MKAIFPFAPNLLIVLLIPLISGHQLGAQTVGKGVQRLTPLKELLRPDGTLQLKEGLTASLDIEGWRMVTDQGGEPRFIPMDQGDSMDPDDIRWDSRFSYGGTGGDVFAIAANGSNIFVGGVFQSAGASIANNIARWDGTSWSPLGTGTNSGVVCLAVVGPHLYAGGWFTTAGGVTANRIAKWDGASWSALGSGMDGSIYALAVVGTDLYAGGYFTTAGGVAANNIARWDGNSWYALGSGMDDGVLALSVLGTDLYAGGFFTTAGGVATNNIAKWDGNSWSALGSGMDGGVSALATVGTELFTGGFFTTAGGVAANRIAKWDGASWSALGTGLNGGVSALAAVGTGLYAGGFFTTAGGVTANNVAKWDGSNWSALGTGTNSIVRAAAGNGNDLYIGGWFSKAGSLATGSIAKWSGSTWSVMFSPGPHHGVHRYSVSALVSAGNHLYAGGRFEIAGNISVNNVARWSSAAWSVLGGGVGIEATAIAVSGNDVYAGGSFTSAEGVSANHIAKWDGTSWSALGTGMNNSVHALAVIGTDLYAGGYFTTAGGISANRIAKWDGTSWSALGSGMNGTVNALIVVGTDLYAGGEFTTAGGVTANRIAKWDGTSWSALGSGTNHHVKALAVVGTDIYAGGGFTTAGGISANRIAKWDGTSWSALGSGMNDWVYALASVGTDIYAGGWFTIAGGVAASNIAKWDGTSWSALGSGMNGAVNALAVVGTDLYAGGGFTLAGGKASNRIARWFMGPPEHAYVDPGFSPGNAGEHIFGYNAFNTVQGGVDAVAEGGTLTISPASYAESVTINKNLTLTSSGTVTLEGLTLTNDKTLTLEAACNVSGTLALSAGKIILGANSLTSGVSGTITGGSSSGYVITGGAGSLVRTGVGTTAATFPVGTPSSYNPVTIATGTGTDNFSVRVTSGVVPASNDDPAAVQRTWTLVEETPGGNGTIVFTVQWNDGEQGATFDRVLADGWRHSGSRWTRQTNSLVAITSGTTYPAVATVATMNLSSWTIANSTGALPIQLASFTGIATGPNTVRLDWSTISEINNYGFYVQLRRENEPSFTELPNSFVPGNGTTNTPQYYSYIDNTASPGLWFYRLKQVDLDGAIHFTEPIQVDVLTSVRERAPLEFALLQNYPNPFNPSTEIKFSVKETGHARLEIYNLLGQRVTTLFDDVADAGEYYKVRFDATDVASGVYLYRLQSGTDVQTKKLVVVK